MRRTLLIGDVHGCNDELGELLQVAGWTSDDGSCWSAIWWPKALTPQGVVARARELGALAVLGNHDAHLLDVRAGLSKKAHHSKLAASMTEADWTYLDQLPALARSARAQLPGGARGPHSHGGAGAPAAGTC